MSDWTHYDIERFISRHLWRPLQLLASAVHPLPILGGVALFVIFAFTGQLRELYYANAEILLSREWFGHTLLGGLALSIASAALYLTNYQLASIKIDMVYGGNTDTDRWLRAVRAMVGGLAAYLPWLGVGVGFFDAASHAQATLNAVGNIQMQSADLAKVAQGLDKTQSNLWIAAAVVAILGVLVVTVIHRLRHNGAFRWAATAMVIVVIFVLALGPIPLEPRSDLHLPAVVALMPDPIALFRAFGPVGTIALTFTALYAFLAVIAQLALRISFPVLPVALVIVTLMVLIDFRPEVIAWTAMACFLAIAGLGLASRRVELAVLSLLLGGLAANSARQLSGLGQPPVAQQQAPRTAPKLSTATVQEGAPVPTIGDAFGGWLAARAGERKAFAQAGKPYPVFVVAAQGGGIYAATAAQAFLAEVQARCPLFARHTFAISAVSGGAIGAALFQSGLGRADPPSDLTCDARSGKPANEQPAARIVGDDHLSPLVGTILADLLGVVSDRAKALEQSFADSARTHDAGTHAILGAPYAVHWAANANAPALVLNTTWSETGYRVAFAPFLPADRANGGDDTVLSFLDPRFDGVRVREDSVISAAVASARFPGILPAYTLPALSRKANAGRWNFVDGGYADASGAATATDLYQALEALVAAAAEDKTGRSAFANVDLRLILLTSYRPPLEFADIGGTIARDSAAPLLTLLNVRELLSQQAVTRALVEIEKSRKVADTPVRSGEPHGWKVALVELDQTTFNLPLGWRISDTTRKLVTALMGAGAACTKPASAHGTEEATVTRDKDGKTGALAPKGLDISAERIRSNACVIQAISALLQQPAPRP